MNRGRWGKWKYAGKFGFLQLDYEVRHRKGKEGFETQFRQRTSFSIVMKPMPINPIAGVLKFQTTKK